MKVHLLYFASFREAAGKAEETRELAEGARLSQLWEALAREIPAFGKYPKMPAAAVNREYATGDTVLGEGDEVAFLPPVAGG